MKAKVYYIRSITLGRFVGVKAKPSVDPHQRIFAGDKPHFIHLHLFVLIRMHTLENNTAFQTTIIPMVHGLYKLTLKPTVNLAIQTKPVFGANVTFHSDIIEHPSFVASPRCVIGWLDVGGLSYLSIEEGIQVAADNSAAPPFLPSQFLHCDRGILRVNMTTRFYPIAKNASDAHEYGAFFFTPV